MSDGAELPESSPEVDATRRFGDLRSVRWRIDLGVLPSSQSASIDELRGVTADSRRRYASLRRRLLIERHIFKDGNNLTNLAVDNPLSQNPESSWGRFFRNAELEKMVDQDLSRLYPEDGSYFQTPGCQGMLRRILLVWCLRQPQCGYRQGMHELLAPLIYVLQADINRLSQVRELYEDHFADKFDKLSVHESDLTYNFDYKRFSNSMKRSSSTISSHENTDPDVQKIVLLTNPYGAEGELGTVISEKFIVHDAYSMFEALIGGANGSVAMADFFLTNKSSTPVIEASAEIYHLLSIIDSPLHAHLTELGVEPHYFGLRWLRLLFGREFALPNLLMIWDEIFAQDNRRTDSVCGEEDKFTIFGSARGAFIVAMAVSMVLYLRPSLLGAEISTSVLQRLLNFPQNVDMKKLIQRAKSVQLITLDGNSALFTDRRKATVRGRSMSYDSVSPRSPLNLVPDCYWEERWKASVRRSLREDLSWQLGSDEDNKGIVPEDEYSGEDFRGEESSSVSSDPSSPLSGTIDTEQGSPLLIANVSDSVNGNSVNKADKDVKEQRTLFGKFRWLWKFGRDRSSEEPAGKGGDSGEAPKSTDNEDNSHIEAESSVIDRNHENFVSGNGDGPELNVISTSKNLGQSMLEHIQVIESVFREHRGNFGPLESFSKNVVVLDKGQVTAMAALKELRKISNLLSEMSLVVYKQVFVRN